MVPVPEPLRFNGQKERIERIPRALKRLDVQTKGGIDVIAVQELIPKKYRTQFKDKMKHLGWRYSSNVLKTNLFETEDYRLVSSGIFMFSKFPILHQASKIFDTPCEGTDCLVAKGVVFCRILVRGNVINIFSTHMQAWDTEEARKIRMLQSKQCGEMLDHLNIQEDEALIFMGDLNIDYYTRQDEIEKLLENMNMRLCTFSKDGHRFTSDPTTNQLMGNDEDVKYSTEQYPGGCYDIYMKTLSCPCCPSEWLDYMAYSRSHLKPVHATMKAIVLKPDRPFKSQLNVSMDRELNDLSDHYPLLGTFEWDKKTPFRSRVMNVLPDHKPIREGTIISFWIVLAIVVLLFISLGLYIHWK